MSTDNVTPIRPTDEPDEPTPRDDDSGGDTMRLIQSLQGECVPRRRMRGTAAFG